MSNSRRTKDAGPSPKFRFSEFDGEKLHAIRLGEVTDEPSFRNRGKLPAESVMGVRKDDGIVPMEERLVAADTSRYKIVRNDWFAYNPMRLNIGSIARWSGENDVLVSPDYVVFRCLNRADPTGILPAYLDHFRQTRPWETFVNGSGDGGVRVRIYYRDLARMELLLPDLPEQRKIANCLSSIDGLIDHERKKLRALEEWKSGLAQNLFPEPGESTPRIRFPEFENAASWQKTTIGQVGQFYYGKSAPKWSIEDNAPTPCVRYGELYSTFGAQIIETVSRTNIDRRKLRFSKGGEILVPRVGERPEDFGRCCSLLTLKGIAIGEMISVFKTDQDAMFYTFYFRHLYRDFAKVVEGQNVKNLYYSNLEPIEIFRPSIPEQIAIGKLLLSAERITDLLREKVEHLVFHKQALSQGLFASRHEAQA